MGWTRRITLALLAALAVTGCRIAPDLEEDPAASRDGVALDAPPPLPEGGDGAAAQPAEGALRLEISLAERELRVYRGERVVETHPVAIGQEEYPTPPGTYRIDEVVWNPEWIPPDSEWAEDRERKAPGDPDNPLGHAQLVFQRPYSIHGTRDTGSLGRAASHGSVRVSNEVATQLARMAMEAGGAARSEDWYREAQAQRTQERTVMLPQPIPLRIEAR
jgi:murein L,D-transpeptidase YcbB/YkuD